MRPFDCPHDGVTRHRRALRLLVAAGASLTLPWPAAGTAAFAATSAGGSRSGMSRSAERYANGILLPTKQWIKPIGTRVLLDQRRPPAVLVASAPTASTWPP